MPSRLSSLDAQKNDFKYPHPFFRLDSYFMPPSIKELFKWIKAIFYGDAMVGSTITKIAEYPVTNLIIETDNENTRRVWEYLFNDVVDIQSMLIQIGLDYFCFHGDTKVTTRNGVFRIRDLAGQTVDVLSEGGVYRPATFSSHGRQPLLEVEFNDGRTLLATPEHEWQVVSCAGNKRKVPTTELAGKRILRNVAARPDQDEDFREGVRHGFVFGDGTLYNGGKQARANFYGLKDRDMLEYFEGHGSPPVSLDVDPVMVHGLPVRYKEIPSPTASAGHWYGFVCGFLAADGCVDADGCTVLTQKAKATLDAVADQLPRIGMIAGQVRGYDRETNFPGGYEYEGTMHFLSLFKQYMVPDDFLLSTHRARFEENYKPTAYGTYVHVRDVKETGIVDEVFCCVEMETHTFTVDNGVLTGNCFGNAFVSVYFPFTRWLVCTQCDDRKNIEDCEYKVSGKGTFKTLCKKCGSSTAHKSEDVPLEQPQRINLVRFDPTNIAVRYNPISGRSHYRYVPSSDIRRAVFQGEPEILNELPAAFIEAVRENKAVKLAPWNIFHFKRPTLAEGDMGWGKPLILHSMKRVFYLNVLRKAQEQVAVEHIIPMDILFPTSSGPVNPFTHTNMAETRSHIEDAVVRWRQDRNYKPVFPIPVGTARVGGDGRALLLGPEIDAVIAEIAAGMGVPREFVFGGLSWTGSSVSLRMLENHFLIYRKLMMRFVVWMKDMLRIKYRLPDVSLRFADFKMADDIQKKQLLLQLNAGQKVGTPSLLQELDMDPEKQADEIASEMSKQGAINELLMKSQARAQGEALLVQTRYQARAQSIMAEEEIAAQSRQMKTLEIENADQYASTVAQEKAQRLQAEAQLQAMQMQLEQYGPMALMGGGAPQEEGAPAEEQPAEEAPPEEEQQMQEEAPAEEAPVQGEEDQFSTPTGEQTLTIDPSRIASSYASRLQRMSPSDRSLYSQHLQTNMPNLWGLMSEYMTPSVGADPSAGPGSNQGL